MESHSSNEPPVEGARITPQDENAEKSLLGAILLSDNIFPDILERVNENDFTMTNIARSMPQ